MYTDSDNTTYIFNYIMGMWSINSIIPVCIQTLIKSRNAGNNNYSSAMSILQTPVYNNMTVYSEWEKITKLQGYEDGLVIDDSGVVENFKYTIYDNCYKEIQIRS